jgi:integrase/recombinase XerC
MTSARAALMAWLEHLAKERRASPRTVEAYGFAAGRYIGFLERHTGETVTVACWRVSAGELRAWLAHLRRATGRRRAR